MTYKVTFATPYNFSVKSSQPINPKVSFGYTVEFMPQTLNDLTDVEITGDNDQYVLMYDAPSGLWKNVNPDEVLSAAATEPIQPGLPSDFVDTMDVDLDNRINLDAGTF
jgi:hypothetical protein